MTEAPKTGAVVLVGCGRLGSAILEGWLATGAVEPADLIILTPSEKPAADLARDRGARINPPLKALSNARAMVLAVKPAIWREAVSPLIAHLAPGSSVISVMAGVAADDIALATGRGVARVMPTTAVAQARGVAALWAADDRDADMGRRLFGAIADIVDLDEETSMDAATAVAASAPAFIYAFVQALADAGQAQGLPPEASARLARGALRSTAAGVESGQGLDALISRIASPGGTTRAGLDAMSGSSGVDDLAARAVMAAVARARALSG